MPLSVIDSTGLASPLTGLNNPTVVGNMTFSTNGGGINFTQSSAQNAATFNDYEYGTWSPTISSGTFNALRPRYTKVGRLVTVSAYCDTFSDRSSSSSVSIGGLPFVSGDVESLGSIFMRYTNNSVSASYIGSGSSSILFYAASSGGYAPLLYSQLNNSSFQIYFAVTYAATF